MKTSRFIAGLSAAIIATSMSVAIPAAAGGPNAGGTAATTVANYDLIDVVNAMKDAGFDAKNVQNVRNFLILNSEFFDGNDYQDMINAVNEIRILYFDAIAMRIFGKTPAQLTQAQRYHMYDNLQPAARDSIKKKFEKLGEKKFVKTEWSVQTVKTDTTSTDYALWYGTLDVTKAVRKADIQKNPNVEIIPTGTATKISKCTIKLAGTKLAFKAGVKRAPKVTITYNGKTLTKNKDYTLSYKNLDKIGKASIIIEGKGAFTGKKTVYFYIVPEQAKISQASKSGDTVKFTVAKDANLTNGNNSCTGGYQIQFGSTKSFDSGKVRTFSTKNYDVANKGITFTNLTGVKYVRTRAFINVKKADGATERHYGAWSTVKAL